MNTTEEKREAIPNSVCRMLITGVGVLLQVLWLCWLALRLNSYSTAISVATSVLAFIITLRIYGLHINAAYKISWIILIPGVRADDLLFVWPHRRGAQHSQAF